MNSFSLSRENDIFQRTEFASLDNEEEQNYSDAYWTCSYTIPTAAFPNFTQIKGYVLFLLFSRSNLFIVNHQLYNVCFSTKCLKIFYKIFYCQSNCSKNFHCPCCWTRVYIFYFFLPGIYLIRQLCFRNVRTTILWKRGKVNFLFTSTFLCGNVNHLIFFYWSELKYVLWN